MTYTCMSGTRPPGSIREGELRVRCDWVVDVDAHVVVARVARDGLAVGAFCAVAERVVALLVHGEVSRWAGQGFIDDGEAEAEDDGELVVVARHRVFDGQRGEVFGASRGCEGCASAAALGVVLGNGLGLGMRGRL